MSLNINATTVVGALLAFIIVLPLLFALSVAVSGAIGYTIGYLFIDALGFSTSLTKVDCALLGAIVGTLGGIHSASGGK